MSTEDNTAKSAPVETIHGKKPISLWKVLLPVAIGLGVVALMFMHDARKENLQAALDSIQITPWSIFCVFLAILCMAGRDFGLIWRFRELTDNKLSWKQAWEVDMLCEFTNCVTPSAVGGSSLGPVYLNSEGIEFGKATTLMLTTLFMDELFFVISCPIVVAVTPSDQIFQATGAAFSHGIKLTFWVIYGIITLWTFILFLGILWKPMWIQKTLDRIASWHWLHRWSDSIRGLGQNMIATSRELKSKSFWFWLRVFIGTALAWTARYFVVNALFLGFLPGTDRYQWDILARQFVIWVVLMISPTPGGSGLSEWLFSNYYGDLVSTAGIALIMAVFWRLITYYLYMLIGCFVIPFWFRGTYTRYRERLDREKGDKASSQT